METPAVKIDLATVEANISNTQKIFDHLGVAFRPHIKTHRIPAFAKKQLAAGACGITCQKIGEAEVMAASGIDDILITYNIIGEEAVPACGAGDALQPVCYGRQRHGCRRAVGHVR